MFQRLLAVGSAFVFACVACGAETAAQAELQRLLRILPKAPAWEEWQQRTGELPPDFSKLRSNPFLPDPLRFENGDNVTRRTANARRAELLKLFEHYITGRIPDAPGNVRAAERVQRDEGSARVEELVLEFGPGHRAKLHVELILPKGKGPFPVFITQDNHRRWAQVAASRGYIGCVYAGADSRDDTADWMSIWPDYDWTKLARRGWAASRCIDYLLTRSEVDGKHIALSGHSRNGKASIIGAAFDPRITAVISASSGAGGANSFRFFSERQAGESIEFITRNFSDWMHPRLRFFAGREEKLPIDMPELIACIAPRAFLFSTALNDNVESVWAVEQSFDNARRMYHLLGASNAIDLLYREGGHNIDANDLEQFMDWLDWKLGRSNRAVRSERIFPTYADWQRHSGESISLKSFPRVSSETPRLARTNIIKGMRWALGEAPSTVVSRVDSYGVEPQPTASMLGRQTAPAGLAKRSVNFGNYVAGDLYFPTNAEKLTTLIWLHPMSVSHGYVPGYKRGDAPHVALARAGFAVFAFDQIGNGSRIEEVKDFYARYPHWSLLGKTVRDTQAALDALGTFPAVDTNRIWLIGFGTGASAALHVAALDARVRGVAAVSGFEPMRPCLPNRGVPTAAKSQHWFPLAPRLGAFAGEEDRLPYDHRELVEVIAPRPVLLFAPRLDEQVDAEDLARVYAPMKHVRYEILDDYNRFGPEVQKTVIDALKAASAAGK